MWRMLAVNFPSILDRSTAGHTCVSISPVVGDSPRIGSLIVKSRGFVGVHREFTVSRIFSRRRFSRAIFRNRGFPTFPLGDLLRSHRNPVNSRTTRGRTDTNHKNPLFLPHRPPTASHRPVIPPTSPTREPPQRRQKVGILNSLFLASKICTRKLSSSRRPITTANQHTGIDNPPA